MYTLPRPSFITLTITLALGGVKDIGADDLFVKSASELVCAGERKV